MADTLKPGQWAALTLRLNGHSSNEIATGLRLSTVTVKRWLRDPVFQAELSRERRRLRQVYRLRMTWSVLAMVEELNSSVGFDAAGWLDEQQLLALIAETLRELPGAFPASPDEELPPGLAETIYAWERLGRADVDWSTRAWLRGDPTMNDQLRRMLIG